MNTFYIMTASDFRSTPFGQLLLAFTSFFLNLLLTLVVGVFLNIVSMYQYKSYLREEKRKEMKLINEHRIRAKVNKCSKDKK